MFYDCSYQYILWSLFVWLKARDHDWISADKQAERYKVGTMIWQKNISTKIDCKVKKRVAQKTIWGCHKISSIDTFILTNSSINVFFSDLCFSEEVCCRVQSHDVGMSLLRFFSMIWLRNTCPSSNEHVRAEKRDNQPDSRPLHYSTTTIISSNYAACQQMSLSLRAEFAWEEAIGIPVEMFQTSEGNRVEFSDNQWLIFWKPVIRL